MLRWTKPLLLLLLLPSVPHAEGLLRSERSVLKTRVVFPEVSNKAECQKKARAPLRRAQGVLKKLGSEQSRFRSLISFERSRETGLLECALTFESFSDKYVLVEMESVSQYVHRGENCSEIERHFTKNPWVFHHSTKSGIVPHLGSDCVVSGVRVASRPREQ